VEGETKYPNLQFLFDAYLNQDYDLYGEKISDVLRVYRSEIDESMRLGAITEIETFKSEHREDLASAFESNFEQQISLAPSGYTAQSFLEELKRLLCE